MEPENKSMLPQETNLHTTSGKLVYKLLVNYLLLCLTTPVGGTFCPKGHMVSGAYFISCHESDKSCSPPDGISCQALANPTAATSDLHIKLLKLLRTFSFFRYQDVLPSQGKMLPH